MTVFSFLKLQAYRSKLVYKALFSYPQKSLAHLHGLDYDAYWKDKRGEALGQLSPWQKDRASMVIRNVKNEGPLSLGDIGCGDGSILAYLQTRLSTARSVGYDVSKLALQKARENGIETVLLDIQKEDEIEHIEETDFILMFEILEHVPHSEKLLAAAYEKVRKGIFFSIPNTGYMTHRLRLFFGKAPMQWRVYPSEHLRFWTASDLKWWLKALGYENYQVSYYRGIPLLNKILPSLFAAGLFVFIKKQKNHFL